ncbi:hypothetical protein NIES39_E02340 [Arthrospira platensis NIES-39]|nr:hypothetical protein NIES39_E02340 [Arthrospira platensis NIES-39]
MLVSLAQLIIVVGYQIYVNPFEQIFGKFMSNPLPQGFFPYLGIVYISGMLPKLGNWGGKL